MMKWYETKTNFLTSCPMVMHGYLNFANCGVRSHSIISGVTESHQSFNAV